jgi:hypothetical protein
MTAECLGKADTDARSVRKAKFRPDGTGGERWARVLWLHSAGIVLSHDEIIVREFANPPLPHRSLCPYAQGLISEDCMMAADQTKEDHHHRGGQACGCLDRCSVSQHQQRPVLPCAKGNARLGQRSHRDSMRSSTTAWTVTSSKPSEPLVWKAPDNAPNPATDWQ